MRDFRGHDARADPAASALEVMSPPLLRFRPLVVADQDRLWHWLRVALWDPLPARGMRGSPREISE